MFMNIRKKIYKWKSLKQLGYNERNDLFINGKCVFNRNCEIGKNCHFNGMIINGIGKVKIGDNFHSGDGCLIITQNHNYDGGSQLPYDNTYIIKEVIIGKNVWLGSRVVLLPGCILGDGSIVQAGSVVHGEIPPLAIVGGNPAKIIKYRDKGHYDILEKEGAYS